MVGRGCPHIVRCLALSMVSIHQMAVAFPPPTTVKLKMFPHIVRCTLEGKITPVENPWCRALIRAHYGLYEGVRMGRRVKGLEERGNKGMISR